MCVRAATLPTPFAGPNYLRTPLELVTIEPIFHPLPFLPVPANQCCALVFQTRGRRASHAIHNFTANPPQSAMRILKLCADAGCVMPKIRSNRRHILRVLAASRRSGTFIQRSYRLMSDVRLWCHITWNLRTMRIRCKCTFLPCWRRNDRSASCLTNK